MELTADALNSFTNVLPTGFFNNISETLGIPVEKTKALVAILNQYPTARIRIVGHTDNIGVESANQKLSPTGGKF